jgi:hypothetical protein
MKSLITPLIEGWVGPGARLDAEKENLCLLPRIKPEFLVHAARRYTITVFSLLL